MTSVVLVRPCFWDSTHASNICGMSMCFPVCYNVIFTLVCSATVSIQALLLFVSHFLWETFYWFFLSCSVDI